MTMLDGIQRNYITPTKALGALIPSSSNPFDYQFENVQLLMLLTDFYNDSKALAEPHPNTAKIADIYPKLSIMDKMKLQHLFDEWISPPTSESFTPADHRRMELLSLSTT